MPQRIIKVPAEGDCYFHVVAYFRGAGPKDVGAALTVRRALAAAAAYLLFKPPYSDLATLTGLVRTSTQGSDLNVVQYNNTAAANSLQELYQGGPYLDGGKIGRAHV